MHPMKPKVGLDVQFQAYGVRGSPEEHTPLGRAAKITDVIDNDTVNLVIFNPTGIEFRFSCKFDEGTHPVEGTWRWAK